MLYITTADELAVRKRETKGKLVVWYSAAWCVPCQKMEKPLLSSVAEESGITLLYCDQPEVFHEAEIRKMPTFICYVDGVEVARRLSADTAKVCMWMRRL
jgi:thiol-disulfide isomerase/thioredoxin